MSTEHDATRPIPRGLPGADHPTTPIARTEGDDPTVALGGSHAATGERSTTEPPTAEYRTTEPPTAEYRTGEPPTAEYRTGEPPTAPYATGAPPTAEHGTGEPPSPRPTTPRTSAFAAAGAAGDPAGEVRREPAPAGRRGVAATPAGIATGTGGSTEAVTRGSTGAGAGARAGAGTGTGTGAESGTGTGAESGTGTGAESGTGTGNASAAAVGTGTGTGTGTGGTLGGPPPVPAPGDQPPTVGAAAYAGERSAAAPGAWPGAEVPVSTAMRVGTVVWGLVLAIIGAGVIAVAAGAQFDLELVLIGLLALAGVALVVGSVVTSARRRR